MCNLRGCFIGSIFKITRPRLEKRVSDESFKAGLINEMNYRLLIMEADELTADENILWVEDIMITPIKKPGLKKLITDIIHGICIRSKEVKEWILKVIYRKER